MKPDWRQVELENPGLSVQSAAVLGEGWNSRVYLVNNELVFRFPKRSEQWAELDREIKFLAFAVDKPEAGDVSGSGQEHLENEHADERDAC